MSEIRDKARGRVYHLVYQLMDCCPIPEISKGQRADFIAEEILSISELAVVDRGMEWPPLLSEELYSKYELEIAIKQAVLMVEAGFKYKIVED